MLLPLTPGLWFVLEGMCYLVWRHCVVVRLAASECVLVAESVGMFVGVTGLCTLGTDGCGSMEHVILLLSISVVAGTFGGTCTLGTHDMLGVCTPETRCILWVVEDVATSANRVVHVCGLLLPL